MGDIARALGLVPAGPFHRDGRFLTALLAGVGFWVGLWLWEAVHPLTLRQIISWEYIALTLFYPCAEEMIFRGFMQGQLLLYIWGQRTWARLSLANIVTSLVFALLHLRYHPPLWALAVAIPSLVFGSFRERFHSTYPAIVLHIFYNAGYFGLTGLP